MTSWLPGALEPVKVTKEDNKWLPQTLVVENRVIPDKEKGGSGPLSKCIGNKKVVCLLIIYALVATGLWSIFLGGPFDLFGRGKQAKALKEQVEILDQEINELETQVDRLGFEVTRLSNETDRLEDINEDLKGTAADLNETVSILVGLNDSFNMSVASQAELSELLEDSVSNAGAINDVLIGAISDLGEKVTSLSDLNADLQSTMEDFQEQKELYVDIAEVLNATNVILSSEVNALEAHLLEMQTQNELLSKNNEDLSSILTFLNQAGLDLNATVKGIEEYLSEEIAENNALVLKDMELSYQNVYFYWLCTSSFEDIFGDESWMSDKNEAIGAADYDTVIEFVHDNVLAEICASKSDFENFLLSDDYIGYQGSSPPVNISFNTLKSAIERYSTMMIEYYFPSDDSGLSKSDWTNARYDCKNIPTEKRYVWQDSS